MATSHVIKIEKIKRSGRLKLSDHEHTRAGKKDAIVWRINDDSEVASIRIEKKSTSPEIFVNPPAPVGTEWKGLIQNDPPTHPHYKYSIFYIKKGSTGEVEFDPKISVNPRSHDFFKVLMIVISALFSILFVTTFLRKESKVHLLKKNDE